MNEQEKQQLEDFREKVDPTTFVNRPYVRRIEKPWGYELHWVPDGVPYMGKLIHIDEGKRLSLQVHDEKREAFFLFAGQVMAQLENSAGELEDIEIEANTGYIVALGQKHRLIGGKGGGSVIEASAPETGNTYRLEDDYHRSTETEAARVERNSHGTNQ